MLSVTGGQDGDPRSTPLVLVLSIMGMFGHRCKQAEAGLHRAQCRRKSDFNI